MVVAEVALRLRKVIERTWWTTQIGSLRLRQPARWK